MKKFWAIMIFIVLFSFTACGVSEENDATIDKLLGISKLTCEDDVYHFTNSEEGWLIGYAESNEFVKFENNDVVACAENIFGEGCMDDGNGFTYDISDNEVRIYTDVEVEDGHLSIVNYNINDEEFTLMIDGERYNTADWLVDELTNGEFLELMLSEVAAFETMLAEYDMTFDDLYYIEYESLSNYL